MSSATEEIKILAEKNKASGEPLTAEGIVEAAQNAKKFPHLHNYLWAPQEAALAMEARISRAHRLIIRVAVTVGETGDTTRLLVHTRGMPGYYPINQIAISSNLAALKIQQLTEDISRARGRLRAFRAALPDSVSDEIDELLAMAEEKAASATKQKQPEPSEAAA